MPIQLRKLTAVTIVIAMLLSAFKPHQAKADLFGGDVAVLSQILVQVIDQVAKLSSILGKARETVSLLEEMNRGVKEVLRLAETAHVPIPAGVYNKAKQIDQAVWEAKRIYGEIADKSPTSTRTHYRSGIEGLFLSQDAFDYSTFLDRQGERVKSSAITASPQAAKRLTAETLGVILHANSHSNRLQAKNLEISSTQRIEEAAKDNAKFESYRDTHQKIEDEMRSSNFSFLNSLSGKQEF